MVRLIEQEAARVTFANFVKRYKSENDDTHAARKARYAKKRRRWARKDLVRPPLSPLLLDRVIRYQASGRWVPLLDGSRSVWEEILTDNPRNNHVGRRLVPASTLPILSSRLTEKRCCSIINPPSTLPPATIARMKTIRNTQKKWKVGQNFGRKCVRPHQPRREFHQCWQRRRR